MLGVPFRDRLLFVSEAIIGTKNNEYNDAMTKLSYSLTVPCLTLHGLSGKLAVLQASIITPSRF